MIFIKLTRADDDTVIRLNINHLISYEIDEENIKQTRIVITKARFYVKETVEQIDSLLSRCCDPIHPI